ncbi:MAG TPA: RNA polymerase sigma factor [Candidatus Paceibacterota bacterium]
MEEHYNKSTKKEAEFIRACEEYQDALFRYSFFKISDRETAKDLVADTFMKVWSYMARGGEIENIRAFFYRTLNNLIIDEYRRKKPISLSKLSEAGFDPVFEDPHDTIDQLDGERAIKMLNRIPEEYKDVIMMKYVEELTLKEIGEIIGSSENAVAVKIHRGIKKMKDIWNKVRPESDSDTRSEKNKE